MSKVSKIVSLLAVILLVVLALPVPLANAIDPPDDVWVAKTGSDSPGYGTQAQPFATIMYGISHVDGKGTVHVAAGTYHENLNISEATNLIGAGAQDTIIDGGGLGRVITISSNPSSNTISGFTIQGGNEPDGQGSYGGGIYISNTHTVTIDDCTIKGNQAQWGGGISNDGLLHMNRCTVSGNSATDSGGGIHNKYGQMWLTNCTISGNHITDDEGGGGGIWNDDIMDMLNCTIAYNAAGNAHNAVGGGFLSMENDTTYFRNTIVANNTAGNSSYNNGYMEFGLSTSQGNNLDSENSCGFDQPTDLINTNPLLGPTTG